MFILSSKARASTTVCSYMKHSCAKSVILNYLLLSKHFLKETSTLLPPSMIRLSNHIDSSYEISIVVFLFVVPINKQILKKSKKWQHCKFNSVHLPEASMLFYAHYLYTFSLVFWFIKKSNFAFSFFLGFLKKKKVSE